MDSGDLAEFSGLHQLHDAPVITGRVVNVVSHLRHPLVIQGGVGHRAPFGHAEAERFLDEDVLASFERGDGWYGVPMVRRDNGNRVDLLGFQQPPEIAESLRLVAFLLLHQSDGPVQMTLVHIAYCRDTNVALAHEFSEAAGTLIADTDESHSDLIAGSFGGQRRA